MNRAAQPEKSDQEILAVGCRLTKSSQETVRVRQAERMPSPRRPLLPQDPDICGIGHFFLLYLALFFNERELDVLSDPQTICRHEEVRAAEGGTHTSTFFLRRLGRTAAAAGGYQITIIITIKKKIKWQRCILRSSSSVVNDDGRWREKNRRIRFLCGEGRKGNCCDR